MATRAHQFSTVVDDPWRECTLILLNGLPGRHEQVTHLVNALRETGMPELVDDLRAVFGNDNDRSFRECLREQVYPHLKIYERLSPRSFGMVVGMLELRAKILREVISGWRMERDVPSAPFLNLDAEKCFQFVCESFQDDFLRGGNPAPMRPEKFHRMLESVLREHLSGTLEERREATYPFWNDELISWLRKDYVPEELLNILLHALVNNLGVQRTMERLELAPARATA